jgi:LacI family transcriptional regulator
VVWELERIAKSPASKGAVVKTSRVTLARVADEAGVSPTTASLILSERPESLAQFNPDTVRRVRESAASLGYRANLFASSLHVKGPAFFALVLHGLHRLGAQLGVWHGHAFDGGLLAGAMHAAAKAGVYPIVAAGARRSDEKTLHNIERLIAGGVLGTIIVTPSRSLERRIRERYWNHNPVIVVFPEVFTGWASNAIDADNEAMGRQVARLLAANDSRRWAVVGTTGDPEAEQRRRRGFQAVAGELGIPAKDVRVRRGTTVHFQRRLRTELRRGRYDGVFAVMANASFGAQFACGDIGIRPGHDLHLVGCDCALWHAHGLPRMTSVEIFWPDVGGAAVEKLLELRKIRGARFENLLIPPHILPGETCPVPAGFQSPTV